MKLHIEHAGNGQTIISSKDGPVAYMALDLPEGVEESLAATSLETIHEQAGHDEWMKRMYQVRGYANSRATVAREALR